MISRRLFVGGTLVAAAPRGRAGGSNWTRISHSEPCMGTMFRMVAAVQDEAAGYLAIRKAFDAVHALDAALSDYKPESELMRLCRGGFEKPFPASRHMVRVLQAAGKLSRESGGAFDITLGPLTRLWRAARKRGVLPTRAELAEARARTGFGLIEIDEQRGDVRLRREGMQLDVGGIAKGYAADEALRILSENGAPHALVAAGGDIATGLAPPGSGCWTVALEPAEWVVSTPARLSLARRAVSTSGHRQQFVEIDGVRYSHIIDPGTGLGLRDPIAVSVVAASAMDSDSLATAASVMGADAALRFLEKRGEVEARISTPEGIRETSGFRSLLAA